MIRRMWNMLWDSMLIALQALRGNLLRTSLTFIAIVVGVMSVITIVSALHAFMANFRKQVLTLGPATFIISKFGLITSRDDFISQLRRKSLTMTDMRAVQLGCPDCQFVGGSRELFLPVKYGNQKLSRVQVQGVTPNYIDMLDVQVAKGRFFTNLEYERNKRVAFIGPELVKELFPNKDPIGREVTLSNHRFTVVGVAYPRGSFLDENQDKFACVPLHTFNKFWGGNRFSSVDIIVKSYTVEQLQVVQDQVRTILRARRGVAYDEKDNFSILTADSILSFVKSFTQGLRVSLLSISSIALVVGGVVIMNIMLVSVTERTREIGIRKSVGASSSYIMLQFLCESLLLTVGGGVTGTSIGIWVAYMMGKYINLAVQPSVTVVVTGLAISTSVGLFFGLYPAIRASKLNPIQAMDHE